MTSHGVRNAFSIFTRTVLLRFFYYFFISLILVSCASQIPPTGGIKDILPPVVEKENPKNLSTYFHSPRISITFNEFVQLSDATNQIFFSPALTSKVEYRLHGKTLLISMPDSLKANTTYTVNFGSAIKDITEGNTMLDYQYVFSTGATIDSFRIRGLVIKAQDGKTKPGLLVMLYHDAGDSVVALQRPDYNARTDSSGHFILNHLAGGNYKLFALEDQDFNLMYTQPGESVGFLDSAIEIKDTTGMYVLAFFKPVAEKQNILGTASYQAGKAMIFFAKRTLNLKITPVKDSIDIITEHNIAHDTISVWVNDLKSDSIALVLHDDDFDDTIKVRMKGSDSKLKRSSAGLTISTLSRGGKGSAQLKEGDELILDFSLPVTEIIRESKVFILEDTAHKGIGLTPQFYSDSATGKNRVVVNFNFRQGIKYTALIPDSSFRDLYGNYNDSTMIPVKVFSEEELGTLTVKISFSDSLSPNSLYYELRNRDGIIVAKKRIRTTTSALHFDGLPPGNYFFKVIEDGNNNFQWDTGNYWKHLQPEKIFFYTPAINIRANWDVDVTMKIENH
ncbi:MAG: Ig-like domain-containing protein [Chitinophagales bacterium]